MTIHKHPLLPMIEDITITLCIARQTVPFIIIVWHAGSIKEVIGNEEQLNQLPTPVQTLARQLIKDLQPKT